MFDNVGNYGSTSGDESKIIAKFERKQTFNMDEKGLMFEFFPRHLIYNSILRGLKDTKARIIFSLCSNLNGLIKLKPFVIGFSQKPRCYVSKILMLKNTLCIPQTKMCGGIQSYLSNLWIFFDKRMKFHRIKYILFVDKATSNIFTINYENFELALFQKIQRRLVNLCMRELGKNFQDHYKKLLVDDIFTLDSKMSQGVDIKKGYEIYFNEPEFSYVDHYFESL